MKLTPAQLRQRVQEVQQRGAAMVHQAMRKELDGLVPADFPAEMKNLIFGIAKATLNDMSGHVNGSPFPTGCTLPVLSVVAMMVARAAVAADEHINAEVERLRAELDEEVQ